MRLASSSLRATKRRGRKRCRRCSEMPACAAGWRTARGECATGYRPGMKYPIRWPRPSRALRSMTDSLSSWLALREPADHAARSASGIKALAERLPRDTPVQVLDLATGSGSNLRFLAGHLPTQQRWLLVDRDGEILQEIPGRMSSWGTARGYEVSVATHRFALRGAQLDCEGE